MAMPSQPNRFDPETFHTQNFIRDPRLAADLVAQSQVGPDDVVYEIGPGQGILTAQLVRRCKQVVAIEKDPALAAALQRKFAAQPNLSIRTADFLDYPLPGKPYKVFGNIPFNITSAVVARLAGAPNPPGTAYLSMQKEAAEMFLGRPHESLRSVLLKPWFDLALLRSFNRQDFTPVPRVDVVWMCLCKRSPPLLNGGDRQPFRDFVAYAFTRPRNGGGAAWYPTLGSLLKQVFSWSQLKPVSRALSLDLEASPSAVSFDQWLGLYAYLKVVGSGRAVRAMAGSEQRLRRQQARLKKVHRTRK
jgi:23S rRNA (adenine-N6)-dimethyltransferase